MYTASLPKGENSHSPLYTMLLSGINNISSIQLCSLHAIQFSLVQAPMCVLHPGPHLIFTVNNELISTAISLIFSKGRVTQQHEPLRL